MQVYEAVLYERAIPGGFKPQPVCFEGRPISAEIPAESASKARFSFFTDLTDYWQGARLQDIHVRSLRNAPPREIADGWEKRLATVNAIIRVIGSHGRHFLSENSDHRTLVKNPFFAHFIVDRRNEIWYVDRASRKAVLVRSERRWTHFNDGGTLRDLVKHFAEHIETGKPINPRYFGPYPEWSCGGDPWGYGEDMVRVREEIAALITPPASAA